MVKKDIPLVDYVKEIQYLVAGYVIFMLVIGTRFNQIKTASVLAALGFLFLLILIFWELRNKKR